VIAIDRAGNTRASATRSYVVDPMGVTPGSYKATVLATSGLLGYWRLGDLSEGVSPAAYGPSNCSLVGGPAPAEPGGLAGDADPAAGFDGVNDYAACGNPASFQLRSGSIEAWLRAETPGAGRRFVFGKPSAIGIELVDGVLTVRDNGTNVTRSTGVHVADGGWHHVVVTFASGTSSATRLYLDGQLVLTTTTSVSSQAYPVQVATNRSSSGVKDFLRGTVDEAAIYGTILDASQVAEHHRQGTAPGS
jgi:hypothetical protein